MKYLSNYDIAFKGLKDGKHQFEFAIDDTFFEKFENSEVVRGQLDAVVNLTKQSTLLILEMTVEGRVELMCDRCLENYMQAVRNSTKLYVKFGDEEEEASDEIIVLPFEKHQINMAYYLYELTVLGLPIKHVHPNNGDEEESCNPDMVKKLDEYLVEENSEDNEEPEIDDRWSELKKLLDNK